VGRSSHARPLLTARRRLHYRGHKRGDAIGSSGHNHQKGEKGIALVENPGSVLSPLTGAPVNAVDMVLLPQGRKALNHVTREAGLEGSGAGRNLAAGCDSKAKRQSVFTAGLKPNITENPRNRQTPKRVVSAAFEAALYKLRFIVERTFAWEDKFKRLLLRFETTQSHHLGFKLIAFTLINLREFCEG